MMPRCLFLFLWMSAVFAVAPVRASIPTDLEPSYSEAVLSYNSKDYDRALGLLDSLIRTAPSVPDFLELKALILKSMRADGKSIAVYQQLIAQKASTPEATAPYHFELGTLFFRAKNHPESRLHLETAIRYGFNVEAASFFLGMMAFADAQWEEAIHSFGRVRDLQQGEFHTAAAFYMAQAYLKMNLLTAGVRHFLIARDEATTLSDAVLGKQIYEGASNALTPHDRRKFFADVALLAGYDTNVLLMPYSVTAPTQISHKATFSGTLLAGAGYMTSPIHTYQAIPSLRFSANKNLTSGTQDSEFATTVLSLFLNRTPMKRLAAGLKLEGLWIFQNSNLDGILRQYLLAGSTGPYLKFQWRPFWTVGAEFFVQFNKYFGDATAAASQIHSGQAYHARVFAERNANAKYWNPSFSLSDDIDNGGGSEMKSNTPSTQLSNAMNFTDKLKVTPGLEFAVPLYLARSPSIRVDKTFSASARASYRLTPRLTLLADAKFVMNTSTDDADNNNYAYNRVTTSLGLSCSF